MIHRSLASTILLCPLLACQGPLSSSDSEAPVEPGSGSQKQAVELQALEDREVYARLGEQEVRALARGAQAHWSEELSGFELERVERFEAGGEAHWMSVWSHEATGLEFVLVPGSTFTMGSPSTEYTRADEMPQHEVSLGPFLMARTECTQEAWARVAGAAGLDRSPFYGGLSDSGLQRPMESVSWEDASRWCEEAGLMLPTEAQWEYACRAGTRTEYAFGDELTPEQARLGRGRGEGPGGAGELEANAFGLHDMHGNLFEWCRDGYVDYGGKVQRRTGLREGTSSSRVRRSSSFYGSAAQHARSASRYEYEPGITAMDLGLRPALDLR